MTFNNIHTESTFESAIFGYLTSNGWHLCNSLDFNRDLAFDKNDYVEIGFKPVSQRIINED
ncbi:MAG: hypothetical protein SCARUB_03556 [Candidatus Scalindua rubra]|uniref:Uncharacterized protein n=1 Tax=Candidatus Scalindua rubra TaxID=1872076 RepID=A0A1E3X6S7_9BACT|nr:MAG: hypothetical protein SCARUB_03556 [Candidatus Scalindua rubra]